MKSMRKLDTLGVVKHGGIGLVLLLLLSGLSIARGYAGTVAELNAVIQQHNLKWTAGETAFSQLSPEEKQRLAGGLRTPAKDINPDQIWKKPEFDPARGGYPLSYNLWAAGAITPVRNQNPCGSCWAFSSVANLEALLLQAGQGSLDLSEQALLNCTEGTCSGWYLNKAFDFLKTSGTTLESIIPYLASDTQPCTSYTATAYIQAWEWVNPTQTPSSYYDDLIKTFIYTYGKPVSTYMAVYDSFFDYVSGIYEHIPGETNNGGHFVLIVGWGNEDGNNYWICKNSWGTSWGQSGLFYIKAQDSYIGTNAIGASVSTPTTTTTTTTSSTTTTTLPTALPNLRYWNASNGSFKVSPQSGLNWGDSVTTYYGFGNYGTGEIPSGTRIRWRFYLSSNSTITTSDYYWKGYYSDTGLAAGYGKYGDFTEALPSSPPSGFSSTGTIYIGMILDPLNEITESNESDNSNQGLGKDYSYVSISGGTAPSAPTNVSASDGTYTDKVRITWSASSGATSYEVYRATSSGGTKSKIGTPSTTSYDDTSASVGTTYYYWVTAKNTYGTSGYSSYNTGYRNPCPDCSGGTIENFTFKSGTTCECACSGTLTIGAGVTVESGATVTFKAPTIKVQNSFHAYEGAKVYMKQQ